MNQLKSDLHGQSLLHNNNTSIQELMAQKRNIEFKLMHARSQLEDVRANVKCKEDIFKSGKGYEE